MSLAQASPVSLKALVVDDDPLLLALLEAFMESRGYAVQGARNGEEALARLEAGGFDVVVTDWHMPRMDGLALCRAIRARPADNYVYCVMLTASVEEDALVAAMEAGVDDFVTKPLRPAELGARLRAAERVLALQSGLANRNRELSEAYGQLSRDLELARGLQQGQLPPPQAFGRVRLEGMFEPSSFVGGDLYAYFAPSARFLAFYLADISGHGVAAAMMAVAAQHQLGEATQQVVLGAAGGDRPRDIATRVVGEFNRRFLRLGESGLYLTLVFGLLDLEAGAAALVHAGHPPALFAAAGRTRFEPVGESGLPIGIVEQADWDATEVPLQPGARLVLYSDGITECRDGVRGEEYGQERLRQLLHDSHAHGAAGACATAREALRGWRGGAFEDDVTLLALEVR
ncbi:MAG TPA: SpoIIE family protein phosphatase [Ramlibacter sp.]|nr:SpoIIE family protein phosphatase [Ramlibacter sp.]